MHAMHVGATCYYPAFASEMDVEQSYMNANGPSWPRYHSMETMLARTNGTTKKRSKVPFRGMDIFAKGKYCEVHKHWRLGCAIVHFESEEFQKEVLKFVGVHSVGERVVRTIGAYEVTLKHHLDDTTCESNGTGIFMYWGHRAEKLAPFSVTALADHVDRIARDVKTSLLIGVRPPRADQVPLSRFSVISS